MKAVLIGLCFITSLSTYASSPQAGDQLKPSVDWERIERGLENGDFSCRGSCAEISIDWKKVWLTMSGQKYRSQRRQDVAYCIEEYQKIKNSFDNIAEMEERLEINSEKASIQMEVTENSLRSVDLVCERRLGKRKSDNLRDSILNEF